MNQKNNLKSSRKYSPITYLKENPHMVVSMILFLVGGVALWQKTYPLAGSLFGAGGALLGSWMTELNKRRSDAQEKLKREATAVAALSPELQRSLERIYFIMTRAIANFSCESALNGVRLNDLQEDFKPYPPLLYPNATQLRDLPSEKSIALIYYYDSLNDLSKIVDDWWERKGQLAVNIFSRIIKSTEKSMHLGLVCIKEFDLEERFSPPYESWGTLTVRIEQTLISANQSLQNHAHRYSERGQQEEISDPGLLRKY